MAAFCTLKLILIGESGVGKTSLLQRFVDGVFRERNHLITFIDMKEQTIQICDKLVKLNIWDTAGQERFRAITREYYRNSDGIILMYDVTEIETYYRVNSWLTEVRKYSGGTAMIIGNKTEDPALKKVNNSVVMSYAKEEGLEFMEISAKTGHNVEKVFQTLVRKILEQRDPTLFESSAVTETSHPEVTPVSTEVSTNDDSSGVVKLSGKSTVTNKDTSGVVKLSDIQPVKNKSRCSCMI